MDRRVRQGTCGWSDSSLVKCKKFYPPGVKTSEDKLSHYSKYFSCVECDSSNYAIPSSFKVEKWIKAVPKDFLFHFKAFSLFTRRYAKWNTVPFAIREKYPTANAGKLEVKWAGLSSDFRRDIWDHFNNALLPAYEAKKLGVVIFQFPSNIHPSSINQLYVEECRGFLSQSYSMAVEFRSRQWFSDDHKQKTVDWLRCHNIGIVITDELKSEFKMEQSTLDDLDNGNTCADDVIPIQVELGSLEFCYIRVHRREGKRRVLPDHQIDAWHSRLKTLCGDGMNLLGPVYFMWGTDHEDQPLINSKKLTEALRDLNYHWEPKLPTQNMFNFFTKLKPGGTPTAQPSLCTSALPHEEEIAKKLNNSPLNPPKRSILKSPTKRSPKKAKLDNKQRSISQFFSKS